MAKFKYKARDPMEIAITVPDIIRRDLFPAWPTRLIDTERNIDILPCHIKIPFVSSISFYYRWSKVVQIKLIGLLLLNLQPPPHCILGSVTAKGGVLKDPSQDIRNKLF